jgi:preprotein translocase subunit SecE
VARDRKRAKQRQARRVPGSAPSQPVREDLPGSLDHASGDVDEFDAALVRGAQGTPGIRPEDIDAFGEQPPESNGAGLVPPGGGSSGGGGGDGGGDGSSGASLPTQPSGARLPSGPRAIAFLRASWAELQRVQWPDRRQVTQATAVVLGFVAIAGAYLGLADYVAKQIVEAIL